MTDVVLARIKACAVIAALVANAWLAIEAAAAARAVAGAARTTERVAAVLPATLDRRTAEIIARLDERTASIERTAAMRLASVERTADARLASIETRLDTRLEKAILAADARLGQVTHSVAMAASRADGLLASADRLVRRADGAVADAQRQIGPWFDCGTGVIGEGRPCVQDQLWWMTLKANTAMSSITLAAETASDTLRRHGPSTARSIDGIASSMDKIGKSYTSKRRLLIEAGLALAGVFLGPGL